MDHAYDRYGTRLAEMTDGSVARASASGKDGIANRREAEERAAAYGGRGGESLVISRVDVRDEPRPWYVGRRGVRDAENEPVVVLRTTPLAKKWFEAHQDAPGVVVLQRRLRCAQRVVEDYSDEISVPGVPSGMPSEAGTEAERLRVASPR
ncbi:hypothetical protein GCM10009716_13500 [Streptomyces sodiiphilus]|uniref:Uncharacterized protein n=1 Tax=Streptomyces sodiiphilus TaxID=226217 RepID=A0ABN2NXS2_9ACTN